MTLTNEQAAKMAQTIEVNAPLRSYLEQFDVDIPALCATVRHLLSKNEKLTHHNQLCEKAFELEDALRLPEVGNLNVLQIVKKMNALAADVQRFSELADERHDQLWEARRQRDDLAAKCAPYLETLK